MKKVNQHILWKHEDAIFTKYKRDLKTCSQKYYFNETATLL